MSTNRTTRRARTAAGRCAVCLRRRRTPGLATCRTCRERTAALSAQLYGDDLKGDAISVEAFTKAAEEYLAAGDRVDVMTSAGATEVHGHAWIYDRTTGVITLVDATHSNRPSGARN